jgi:transforming growth factor-beta-induced protein
MAGLTSLVESFNAAKLTKSIEELKDVTIFAPTNAAFQAAASSFAGSFSNNTAVLNHHVVRGIQYSNALKDGQSLLTAHGGSLKVKLIGGEVYINKARVLKTDVLTKNGVLHIIDGILQP